MTFVVRYRGSPTATTIADYHCQEHGRFELTVTRTPEGDAPDFAPCSTCGASSQWCISAPMGRVNPFEAVKGGWSKPERKTWLDTRELGEGQSMEDFRAKRAEIREEQRKRDVMEYARSGMT